MRVVFFYDMPALWWNVSFRHVLIPSMKLPVSEIYIQVFYSTYILAKLHTQIHTDTYISKNFISTATSFMAIVFTILNAFQGLGIFILTIITDNKILQEIKKLFGRKVSYFELSLPAFFPYNLRVYVRPNFSSHKHTRRR